MIDGAWFTAHFFQPDYIQFYIIITLGFIYFEYRFRHLKVKTS